MIGHTNSSLARVPPNVYAQLCGEADELRIELAAMHEHAAEARTLGALAQVSDDITAALSELVECEANMMARDLHFREVIWNV